MNGHIARVIFAAFLMSLTALAAASVKPMQAKAIAAPDLEQLLPDEFDVWMRIDVSQAVLPAESELGPGEAVAYRAYRDDLGRVVTVVAAYGPPLGDSVRLHRPETCYVAQGFQIMARSEAAILARGRTIPVVNLDAQSPSRREAVTYWLRDGDNFVASASESGWRRLKGGAAADGALLRISTIDGASPAFDRHVEFLAAFTAALDQEAAKILIGGEAAQ